MNEKETIDFHDIASNTHFERASRAVGEMRAKITPLEWQHKDMTQWAEWESDIFDALRKMRAVFGMIHDHGCLLSPEQILEKMKTINDEKNEVIKLKNEACNDKSIGTTHRIRLDNLLSELTTRASSLRAMFKPSRFEDLDRRVADEVMWAQMDMNGLDIEQVEARLRTIKEMIDQALYVYGYDDQVTRDLFTIRYAYQDAYGSKLEKDDSATNRSETLKEQIDNLYENYCKEGLK